MGRTILVLQGHPDPSGGHLCHALADAYVRGAVEAGHGVVRFDLARLQVPLLRTQADFEHGGPPPELDELRAAVLDAGHLVLFFPLWLGGMPAQLKCVLEQLFRPGFAFTYLPGGGTRARLQGRSARVVVTMGMPGPVFRFWYLGAGLSALTRNILRFVGFSPVRSTVLGGVGTADAARRRRWLARMAQLGAAMR